MGRIKFQPLFANSQEKDAYLSLLISQKNDREKGEAKEKEKKDEAWNVYHRPDFYDGITSFRPIHLE